MSQIPPGKRVAWKPYIVVGANNQPYLAPLMVLNCFGNRYLQEIEQMPPGIPISFLDARQMVHQAHVSRIYRPRDERYYTDILNSSWIEHNWVEWIAQQGYQILLDGSEWSLIPDVNDPREIKPMVPQGRPISIALTSQGILTTDRRERLV